MDFNFDLNPPTINNLKLRIITFAPHLLYAFLIIAAGLVAKRLAKRWLSALISRSRFADDLLLKNFFLRVSSFVILVLTFLSALRADELRCSDLRRGARGDRADHRLRAQRYTFKLCLGSAAADLSPVSRGRADRGRDARGTVEELTIVNMKMTTVDGICVIMPNSKVWGSKIINFSQSRHRRLSLSLKVRMEEAERAVSIIRAALAADDRILKNPPPEIRIEGISNNAATLAITPWTDPKNFKETSADVYLKMKTALKEAGVRIL